MGSNNNFADNIYIWPLFIYPNYSEGRSVLWEPYRPDKVKEMGTKSVLKTLLTMIEKEVKEETLPFDLREIVYYIIFPEGRKREPFEKMRFAIETMLEGLEIKQYEAWEEEHRRQLLDTIQEKKESLGLNPVIECYTGLGSDIDDGWVRNPRTLPEAYLRKRSSLKYDVILPAYSTLGSRWLLDRVRSLIPQATVNPIMSFVDGTKPIPSPKDYYEVVYQSWDTPVIWATIKLKDKGQEESLIDLIQWWLQWTHPLNALGELFYEWQVEDVTEEAFNSFIASVLPDYEEAYPQAQLDGRAHLWPLYTDSAYPTLYDSELALHVLPYPFSQMYALCRERFDRRKDDMLEGLIHSAERIIAFMAICIVRLLQEEQGIKISEVLDNWEEMSLGSWVKILKHTGNEMEGGEGNTSRLLPLFLKLFGSNQVKESCARILSLRNEKAGLHPYTTLPRTKKIRLAEEYWSDLEILYFFMALVFQDCSLVLPELSPKGTVAIRYFKGPVCTHVEPGRYPIFDPSIEPWEPALLVKSEKHTPLISLYPLLIWVECQVCQMDELFFFVRRDRRERKAVYMSLSTHHEYRSRDMLEVLYDFVPLR